MRRSRHHTQKTDIDGKIVDALSISERPATVEDRALPGHWEGDLLFGSQNSQIATLVERRTLYVMLAKVDGKDIETVVNALIKSARKLPQELYKSLTWDRGRRWPATSASRWKRTSRSTSAILRTPGSAGQTEHERPAQTVPSQGHRRLDLLTSQVNAEARRLNERPRKTLDFQTPAERFNKAFALIG
jgi:IS30 family transposase